MIQTFTCPDADRWQALLSDSASSDSAELEMHLAGCLRCQAVLDDLAVGSSGWLRDANRLATKTDNDPEMTKTLHRLREVLAVDEHHASEISLHFLTPSDQPGVLGTLGRYQVLEVIGRGAFGIVLKALDPDLLRPVAIKVLAPYLAPSGTARQRFLREARAAAAVIHDNVINVHAVEIAGDLPYIVMEFVTGISLQGRLDRDGPLPPRDIARIGHQAASGLAAAHAQGIVHRDIKPANILLENGVERVKITDFGLARAADDARLTQSGIAAGTPLYMSPEQARGETVDQRSDLFSLGSVLYTLATGFPPFRADSTMGVLNRISNHSPRPIRETNPDFPPALEKIIMQLLEKDPAKRFPIAADVSIKLTGFLSGPEAAPDAEPDETKPTKWWMTALCVLAGIAMVVVVLTFKTAKGTLVVEVDDPEVKVALDGEELIINGAGPQEVRLKPGTYHVSAMKDGKPARVSQEVVTITKNGRQIVKVTLEPNQTLPWTAGFDNVRAAPLLEARLNAVYPKADSERVLLIRIAWLQAQEKSAVVRPTGDVPNPQTHPLFGELKDRAVQMANDNLDPGDVRHVVESAYYLAGKILDGKATWARIAVNSKDWELERMSEDVGQVIQWLVLRGKMKPGEMDAQTAKLSALSLEATNADTPPDKAEKALREAHAIALEIALKEGYTNSLPLPRKDGKMGAPKMDASWGAKLDDLKSRFENLTQRLPGIPGVAVVFGLGPIKDYEKAVATVPAADRENVKKLLALRDQFALGLPKAQSYATQLEDAKKLVASSRRKSLEDSLSEQYAALTGQLREMEKLAVLMGAKSATPAIGDPGRASNTIEADFKKITDEYDALSLRLAKTQVGRVLATVREMNPSNDTLLDAGVPESGLTAAKKLLRLRDEFANQMSEALTSLYDLKRAKRDQAKANPKEAVDFDEVIQRAERNIRFRTAALSSLLTDLKALSDQIELPAKKLGK